MLFKSSQAKVEFVKGLKEVKNMGLGINDIIVMSVSFLLVAVLGPIALTMIANATGTELWDPTVTTIFQVLLPILWIIGIAIAYIPSRGK